MLILFVVVRMEMSVLLSLWMSVVDTLDACVTIFVLDKLVKKVVALVVGVILVVIAVSVLFLFVMSLEGEVLMFVVADRFVCVVLCSVVDTFRSIMCTIASVVVFAIVLLLMCLVLGVSIFVVVKFVSSVQSGLMIMLLDEVVPFALLESFLPAAATRAERISLLRFLLVLVVLVEVAIAKDGIVVLRIEDIFLLGDVAHITDVVLVITVALVLVIIALGVMVLLVVVVLFVITVSVIRFLLMFAIVDPFVCSIL